MKPSPKTPKRASPVKEPPPARGAGASSRRYVALLRGVSPMNVTMPALKSCFESLGFREVKTVLSSGNVLFSAAATSASDLERTVEDAMTAQLGRVFMTMVRPVDSLRELLSSDPYAGFGLPAGAKRVVTFLRQQPSVKVSLPIELDGAQILTVKGREIFTAYLPSPRGAVFMKLIEKTFGKEVTTRTWDTVEKLAR